jgi:hypothetical protein
MKSLDVKKKKNIRDEFFDDKERNMMVMVE